MLLVGLLAIAVMCFAACGGGDDISAPVGDAIDAGDAPNTIAAEATVAPEPTIAADEIPTATPLSARMIANPTAAPTSSSDMASTPVAVSTETPSDVAASTPAPVVVDTPVPAVTEATPAAPTAVATEEPVAEATAVPTSAPLVSGVEITPSQIGAIDWKPYADEGYVFYTRSEGKYLGDIVIDGQLAECGPEIGSSFDLAVNPTHRHDSHFIWVWVEDAIWSVERKSQCVAFSKYVDWTNEVDWVNGTLPNLRESESIRDVADDDPRRATSGAEDLVFFYQVDDRSYTMPPVLPLDDFDPGRCEEFFEDLFDEFCFPAESGLINLHTDFEVPGRGYSSFCGNYKQPLAVWTEWRGFIALSDEESVMALFSPDTDSAMESYLSDFRDDWAEGRAAGVYQIWPTPFHDTPPSVSDYLALSDVEKSYCWVVSNQDEVPIEPCLTCEEAGVLSPKYTNWERR